MTDIEIWIWLATRHWIRSLDKAEFLKRFDSMNELYCATRSEYEKMNIRGSTLDSLCDKSLAGAEKIIGECERKKFKITSFGSNDYPEKLRYISDPPFVLYINGVLPDLDREPVIAIVGTRRAMQYGINVAGRISGDLAAAGAVIVSGLALGIDTAAANGALSAGGSIVGVSGSGLDVIYPRENNKLFSAVAANGAVISEYPPGTRPLQGNFPARNRIISGISDGVIVIEAPKRSGALITANIAIEHGREVFALPGNVDCPNNEGSNQLIKEGIPAITSAEDVIYALEYRFAGEKLFRLKSGRENQEKRKEKLVDSWQKSEYIEKTVQNYEGLNDDEKKTISAITKKNTYVDEIIEASGISAARVLSALTMLEIKGYVKQSTGKYFSLSI